MKLEDLVNQFGIDPDVLADEATSYSELRARLFEEERRRRAVCEEIDRNLIQPLAKLIIERVIASLILEIESDQHMRKFDTTGYE